jgi:pyrimidine-nucleoside phosphorylase
MIELQEGDSRITGDVDRLPAASRIVPVEAEENGYISSFDTLSLGMSAMLLGAGRMKKEDRIDPAVGFWMRKRLGDRVEKGETIAEFHVNSEENLEEAMRRFRSAVNISREKSGTPPLIYETM